MLAEHGAFVVDADALAREALEPGAAGHARVVAEFGEEITDGRGRIDRRALDPALEHRLVHVMAAADSGARVDR